MANPAWFDDEYFAGQKLLQMQILGETIPAGNSDLEKLQAALDDYNTRNGASVDAFANFEACNTQGYIAEIPVSAINVSPNALFDIPYYLTAAAKYANDEGYTATGFDGVWTAETVLQHMYEGGYSAWAHFMVAGLDQRLDCSADFSTGKYIAAKAKALNTTEDDVVAQMKADGLNPVMDYYENGEGLGIKLADLKVDPANLQNVAMDNGDQWGTLAPADPYDDIDEYVTIAAGDDGPYAGQDGVNTQFEAKWLVAANQSTLNADDVVTGGADALNTLAIELSKDWNGFNGVKPEGTEFVMPEDYLPNVTNVGRIRLDRPEGASEGNLKFNAKNISDDVVQYDLNGSGSGTISLSQLSDAVQRVNISNLVAPTTGTSKTTLGWDMDANTGKEDALTIGVNNVLADKGQHVIEGLANVETLTVDAMAGKNNVSVASATDAKSINVTGAGEINLRANATPTVKSFDASAATGNVTFSLTTASATNNQTITGGSGQDTVNIFVSNQSGAASGVNFKAANWSSIETVIFSGAKNHGDTSHTTTTIDARGATDLHEFWATDVGEYTVKNLAAADVIVHQTAGDDGAKATTINGDTRDNQLGNITWKSEGTNSTTPNGSEIKANFSSNATGTATIEVNGEDTLDDGSSFTFGNAQAVVINMPNARATSYSGGVTLVAGKATSLDITADGDLKLAKGASDTNGDLSLARLQTLTATLTNESTTPDIFDMSEYALGQLMKAEINAGGEDVKLGKIGTEGTPFGGAATDGPGFTLKITEANDVETGSLNAGLGNNIDVNIEAAGTVEIDGIATSTNQNVNNQGDVRMVVESGGALTIGSTNNAIYGGELQLDFSNVGTELAATAGAVSSTSGNVVLKAQEGIMYLGSAAVDKLSVQNVGNGSTSMINLGDGGDKIAVNLSSWGASATDKATINVDLGADDGAADEVALAALPTKGVVRVNISGFEEGTDILADSALTSKGLGDVAAIKTALAAAGLSSSLANGIATNSGIYFDTDSGTAYGVAGTITGGALENALVIVLTGDGIAESTIDFS